MEYLFGFFIYLCFIISRRCVFTFMKIRQFENSEYAKYYSLNYVLVFNAVIFIFSGIFIFYYF